MVLDVLGAQPLLCDPVGQHLHIFLGKWWTTWLWWLSLLCWLSVFLNTNFYIYLVI